MARPFPIVSLLAAAAAMTAGAARGAPLNWEDLTSRPRPRPTTTLSYGGDALQHIDLWLPKGAGPFPVVVLVHGGCWRTDVATADLMDWAAADLARRGLAVWNVEYRGIDRPGGGYPGTFRDVATAADALRGAAVRYRLRLDRVAVAGHSAGGHLALWLAARSGLPAESPLRSASPLRPLAAVSLGGLPDLELAATPRHDGCGADSVRALVGRDRRDPFADTSPARLPQPALPITLVNGAQDGIVPPAIARAYVARVRNPRVRVIEVPGEGHADEIAPGSRAWEVAARTLVAALTRP